MEPTENAFVPAGGLSQNWGMSMILARRSRNLANLFMIATIAPPAASATTTNRKIVSVTFSIFIHIALQSTIRVMRNMARISGILKLF